MRRLAVAAAAAVVLSTACRGSGAEVHAAQVLSGPQLWTPASLSTSQYEASAAFTPDGRELFYVQADRAFDNYRLRQSHCADGHWTPPREPAFAAPEGVHDADPFVTPDGARLYFVSTRHRFSEVGNEDFDIFEVMRGTDGSWGAPRRLPEPVNSHGSELLPRMDRTGALYFGSSRPGGKGGSDIYRATDDGNGDWTVVNVLDVNTAASEFEADISADGRRLAVVSDREVRSRIYLYRSEGGSWHQEGRVRAHDNVFQVGPRFSPDGGRLLFSQDDGANSGEIFLIDIASDPDHSWPPAC